MSFLIFLSYVISMVAYLLVSSYLQEKYPHKPWPKDQIWSFKSCPKVIGSPMLDAVLSNCPLDRELVHWLKHRPTIYQAVWDR